MNERITIKSPRRTRGKYCPKCLRLSSKQAKTCQCGYPFFFGRKPDYNRIWHGGFTTNE